jgi:hypothetical protein
MVTSRLPASNARRRPSLWRRPTKDVSALRGGVPIRPGIPIVRFPIAAAVTAMIPRTARPGRRGIRSPEYVPRCGIIPMRMPMQAVTLVLRPEYHRTGSLE